MRLSFLQKENALSAIMATAAAVGTLAVEVSLHLPQIIIACVQMGRIMTSSTTDDSHSGAL
jgi:hypothetical protein